MLPILTRRVIFPTHERILRRPTLRYLSELERSQWWSPDDLRELQRVKLRDQLRHAQTHIPFWRARLHAAGIDVNGNDPLQVLCDIPLLDKAQIRASLDDLLWYDAPGGIHRHATGGSSGEPLIFYLDRRRQGYPP